MWFARTHGDPGRSQAEHACEDRLSERQQIAVEPSTDEQRTEALRIAAADPLVQRLWGGSAPPIASDPGTPGLFIFPKIRFRTWGPSGHQPPST